MENILELCAGLTQYNGQVNMPFDAYDTAIVVELIFHHGPER